MSLARMMALGAPVELMTIVHFIETFEQFVKGQRNAVELFCQFFRPGKGTVGHVDFAYPGLQQVGGGQFGHFPRADEQGGVIVHFAENTFSQLHGRVADGDGAGADGLFRCARALATGKGLVQQPVQNHSGGVLFDGGLIGLFQLPQNLGLAHNHGVQAGSHGKQMPDRFQTAVGVYVGREIRCGLSAQSGPLADDVIEHFVRIADGDNLHAVAG